MFRPTAVDLSISEVLSLETPRRFKTLGVVVYKGGNHFSLNDGDSQIDIYYGSFPSDKIVEMQPHRVIVESYKESEDTVFTLIAAQTISAEDMTRYRELITLERRVNKR